MAPSAQDPVASQPAANAASKPPASVLAEQEAQWLFTEQELASTPSVEDGMSPKEEYEVRIKGLNFILQTGLQLKLPQLTLYSASLFFNRFLMRHSLVNKKDGPKALHHYQIAAVCMFLATKTDESVRKMKEIIVACCRVAQKNPNLVVDENSKDFWRWRDTILLNEDILLETLCFDLSVESPHKLLFDLLKILGHEHNKKLRNAAWSFVSDSGLTTICLLFNSRTIAAAAVYCAARFCGLDVKFADDSRGRPWWKAYKVKLRDMLEACKVMAIHFKDRPRTSDDEPNPYVSMAAEPVVDTDDEQASSSTRLRRENVQISLDIGVFDGDSTPATGTGGKAASSRGVSLEPPANGSGRGLKRESEAPSEQAEKKIRTEEERRVRHEDAANGAALKEQSPAGSEEGEVEE